MSESDELVTWFLDPDLDLRVVGMNPSTCPK